MASPPLSQFLQAAPEFRPDVPLSVLAQTLAQSGCDVGVVVSPQGLPQGVVRANRLLRLLSNPALLAVTPPTLEGGSFRTMSARLNDYPDWLEPVQSLSADLPLDRLVTLGVGPPTPCAVLDNQQRYLGLFDWARGLMALNRWTALAEARPDPSVTVAERLLQGRHGPIEPEPSPLAASEVLFNLIEHLPLAMMIQTGEGHILFRNSAWAAQIPASFATAVGQPTRQSIPNATAHSLTWQPTLPPLPRQNNSPASPPPTLAAAEPADGTWQIVRVPLPCAAKPSFPQAATELTDLWLVLALPPEAAPESAADLLTTAPKPAWLLELNHELKSPLTSLLGLSTLLQDPRLGTLNPRQARYARLIHQMVRRLVATVNQLLDWFRLDSGQLILFPTEVDVQELGPQVIRSIATQNSYQDESATPVETHFSWSVEPGLPRLVADPLRLRQMLHHLVSYRLEQIEAAIPYGLLVSQWGNWLALTLWDRGSGLPAHLQAQLFQDRYAPMAPNHPPAGQTDLGLILTWHLVRLHGGDITFVSSPTRGSQFTLLLPQGTATTDALAGTSLEIPAPLPMTTALIVLACTEVGVIDAVVSAVQETPYRVAIARSAAELLDKVKRLKPTLILLHPDSFSGEEQARMQPLATRKMPLLQLGSDDPFAETIASSTLSPDSQLSPAQIASQLVACLHQLLATPSAPLVVPAGLTILHLTELSNQGPEVVPPGSLSTWLHTYQCRVLEVDDLSQAELLSRVWKPQVVLLDPSIANAGPYLSQLAQLPSLRSRPLVTLTPAHTETAQQHGQLVIFPCLDLRDSKSDPQAAAALMQTILQATTRSQ